MQLEEVEMEVGTDSYNDMNKTCIHNSLKYHTIVIQISVEEETVQMNLQYQ